MSRTAVNVVHYLLIVVNLTAGAIQIRAHHPRLAIFNFFSAGFVLGINIYFNVRRPGESMTATTKAKRNLKKAVKATGAKWNSVTDHVILRPRKSKLKFTIKPGAIIRESRNGNTIRVDGTCFLVGTPFHDPGIPAYERMATALLLLNRDPALFDRWATQNGRFYA